ncbi:hypothetical protein OK18_16200 [Chryseobacterium gallinarum]|uniref:TMF family protein n=1 Tax=Chryseobacterium gallinarum TaxID=1324352 RepID=A0A0G3MA53_CHRGL|nr:hypothetical protein [Chryseobacterium gallinarum]AKK73942.1 hypothetical protein OK18_16200 [Chryseobacterium gallinarum]
MKKITSVFTILTITFSYSQIQPWNTTGNAGTNPFDHFIGTIDNQPLILKTNNIEQLRITPKGKFIPSGTDASWGKNLFFGGGNESIAEGNGRNTIFGLDSFNSAAGHTNTAIGYQAFVNVEQSTYNVAVGSQTIGGKGWLLENTAVGTFALSRDQVSDINFFVTGNSAFGSGALQTLKHGRYNVAIGTLSLFWLASQAISSEDNAQYSNNIGIGYQAGYNLIKGTNNIFIGNEVKSSRSIIDNELNIGNWIVGNNGIIGIGQFADLLPANGISADGRKYKLFVKEGIKTEKIKVEVASANDWADNVFKEDYQLMPLSEVEKHIQNKGHLPNIPSADEVVKNGIDLGDMNSKLLQKIEELTLYQIQMSKDIKELKEENRRLKHVLKKE